MKKFITLPLLCIFSGLFAQNVGIGEMVPTSRLEIKASSTTNSPLLIKSSANEELLNISPFLSRYYTHVGGSAFGTLGVLNITNQQFAGQASPLLKLTAFHSAPTIGSLASLEFGNSNNIDFGYRFDAQTSFGTPHSFSLNYKTNLGSAILMAFNQNGDLGIGGNSNGAKADFFHNSTTGSPQLSLTETESDYSRLSFRNTVNPGNFWSIAGLNTASSINDRLNFYHPMAGDVMSITGDGKVGIGLSNPGASFEVKSTTNFAARFGGTTGMYVSLNENNLYRGYLGSYSGNAEDVDFGTGLGNATGRVHLTIEAVPKLTVEASGTVNLTNELTRTTKTGTANLLPIAYGSINGTTGAIRTGTGNFTATRIGSGYYVIDIAGENYNSDAYVVSITLNGLGSGICRAFKNTAVSVTGMIVFTNNADTGTNADRDFFFFVYKP